MQTSIAAVDALEILDSRDNRLLEIENELGKAARFETPFSKAARA